MIKDPDYVSFWDFAFAIVVAVAAFAGIVYIAYQILMNYHHGEDNFQRVYNDILFQWTVYEWGYDFERAQRSYYYYTMFLLRRWVFVYLPFVFVNHQFLRITLLFLMNIAYTLDYFSQKVQASKTRRRLEMFNEVIMTIIIYHMISFSNLNTSARSAYSMGYSFIVFTVGMILVNLYTTVKVGMDKYKRMMET